MIDNAVAVEVRKILDPTDFFTVDHETIFRGIIETLDELERVDPLLVAETLKKTNQLSRAGGTNYIYELQTAIVETESTKTYAEIVKDYSLRRLLVSSLKSIQDNVSDTAVPVETIVSDVATECQRITKKSVEGKISLMTAKELAAKEFPESKWVIPDLIPTGLTIIAGAAKIGKSFLCWNIAFSVAMGGTALSAFHQIEKKNVLFVALDDSDLLLKERHAKMFKDDLYGTQMPENLFIIDENHQLTFDEPGLAMIEEIIVEHDIELVIVDTWAHVKPDANMKAGHTSYDMDYNALIPVRRFANRNNIAVIVVTHTTKAVDINNPYNQIQGSMGMQAGADTTMVMAKDNGEFHMIVRGRRMPEEEYEMTLQRGGHWKLIRPEGDNPQAVSHGQQEILDAIYNSEKAVLTPKEIADAIGKTTNSVKLSLPTMVEKRLIEKAGYGKYRIVELYNEES